MSNPRTNKTPGETPAQTKTMFYSEGNPTGLLVATEGGIRKRIIMTFATAELALAWCRENGSNLFYTAPRLERN